MIDLTLIEDTDFRQSAIDLNISIPHPNSVLDSSLEGFNPQLYYHLLCMEAYTYDHSSAEDIVSEENAMMIPPGVNRPPLQNDPISGLSFYRFDAGIHQYQPLWTQFNLSLLGYLQHPAAPRSQLKDFIIGLYCFLSVHYSHQEGPESLIDESRARTFFNMDGYIEDMLGYPIDHYDTYTSGAEQGWADGSASTMDASTARIGVAYEQDLIKMDAYIDRYADHVSNVGYKAIFSYPEPPEVQLNPTQAWDIIFDELEWQWYIDYFNANLPVPDRQEPPMPPEGD